MPGSIITLDFLKAAIKAAKHFEDKGLSLYYNRVLLITFVLANEGKQLPTRAEILSHVQGCEEEFEYLLANRYIHEVVNKYGKVVPRYKIGAVGGTILKGINVLGKEAA